MKATFPLLFFVINLLVTTAFANEKITPSEIAEVVTSVGNLVQQKYVFPEKGQAIKAFLHQKLNRKDYKNITTHQALGESITTDIQTVSKDKHLRVSFAPEFVNELNKQASQHAPEALPESYIKRARRYNFGFEEISIKPGNIGYINLTGFSNISIGGDTAVAAMNMVANTDAIIFDLRGNGGGSPSMIQLISSYLFDETPVHLNSFYWRENNRTNQTWTMPSVSGKRNISADVYILTSGYTFSAAEEFAYNLKHQKRAMIIGEITGGGAHPGGPSVVNDNFTIFIPNGRAINPITKTNWEVVGVQPDIKVTSDKALDIAMKTALNKLAQKFPTDEAYYQWHIDYHNALAKDFTLSH